MTDDKETTGDKGVHGSKLRATLDLIKGDDPDSAFFNVWQSSASGRPLIDPALIRESAERWEQFDKEFVGPIPKIPTFFEMSDVVPEGGFKRGMMAIIGSMGPVGSFKSGFELMMMRKMPKGKVKSSPNDTQQDSTPEAYYELAKVIADSMEKDPVLVIDSIPDGFQKDMRKEMIVQNPRRLGRSERLKYVINHLVFQKGMTANFYNGFAEPPYPGTRGVYGHYTEAIPMQDGGREHTEEDIKKERNKGLKQMKTSSLKRGDNAKEFASRNPFMKKKDW